ncbi:MAG: hypothetical protein AAB920_03465, partial [Patescibacteria group bacterium]
NAFIRGPFIVEGIIYGFVATIISFVIMIPMINFIAPFVNKFIPEVDLLLYFSTNYISLFLYQILFCMGLGIISSFVAVRKYLHL